MGGYVGNPPDTTAQNYDERYAPITRGRKNLLINGDFRIWQRYSQVGASPSTVTYTADRWVCYVTGSGMTFYKSSSLVSDGNGHALMVNGVAGNTTVNLGQRIESINCQHAINKNVTISGQIHSGDSRNVTVELYHANTTDTFSGLTFIGSTTVAVTSGATPFTFTLNAGANAPKGLYLQVSFGGITSGSGFGLSKMQLEIGDEATDFEYLPIQEQYNLCYRYYARNNNATVGGVYPYAGCDFARYIALAAGQYIFHIHLPTTQRVQGTVACQGQVNDGTYSAYTAGFNVDRQSFSVWTPSMTAGQYCDLGDWYSDAEL